MIMCVLVHMCVYKCITYVCVYDVEARGQPYISPQVSYYPGTDQLG